MNSNNEAVMRMRRGLNSGEMQKRNRILVFRTLLENGGMSRTQLASYSGLQKATISNIINEFFDMGIVEVDGDSAAGRRAEMLRLKLDRIYLMSMGITRKDFQIAVYSLDGRHLDGYRYSIGKGEDLIQVISHMGREAKKLLDKYDTRRVLSICMTVPGPYMRRKQDGKEVFDVSEFPQFNESNIRERIEASLGRSIWMVHDAKMSAYAEWKNDEVAREDPDTSLVVIRSRGYGIGVGMVVNQSIVAGQLGIAGELGYMGINYNGAKGVNANFESCAGTDSAVRYMRQRLHEFPGTHLRDDSSYAEIVEAYRAGDELAVWAINKMAWMLAYGIANLIYTINPDCIILGADYPDEKRFIDEVRTVLGQFVHPMVVESVHIRYSQLSEDSFLLGAYYYTVEMITAESDFFEKVKEIQSLS